MQIVGFLMMGPICFQDGSQLSGQSNRNSRQIIIGMEDDDFPSEDESVSI